MNEELINKIKLAQSGDKNALNELVEDNYGLVYSIARRFYNRGYEVDDINQIGAIGLVKAIQKFDFSYNVVLSTFAVTYIIGEIKRFLRDDGPVKVSRELKKIAAQIAEEKKNNENISVQELSKKINVKQEDIVLAMESSLLPESLEGKKDDDGLSLLERLKSNENYEEKIVNNLALKEVINRLDAKYQQIIYLRYFRSKTQKDVAKIIGISQVQVSRLESKILKVLEKELLDVV